MTSSIERFSIEKVKKAAENVPDTSRYSKAINFGMSEILRFEEEKKSSASQFNIKIESELQSGSIGLDVLGLISSGLQRAFNSICNNIFGNKKSTGPIPKEVLEMSNLVLTSTSPGSFIMHIDHISKNEQLSFDEQNLIKELENAFEILSSENIEVSKIVELYGPRTFNIFNKWFQSLHQNEVEFSIIRKNNKSMIFNKNQIKKTFNKFSDVKIKESTEMITLRGKIIGANPTTKTLTIITENGEKITAQASIPILHQNLVLLTVNYEIKMKMTKIKHLSSSKTEKTYQIYEISSI